MPWRTAMDELVFAAYVGIIRENETRLVRLDIAVNRVLSAGSGRLPARIHDIHRYPAGDVPVVVDARIRVTATYT